MELQLTQNQVKRLEEFSEINQGIRCWNTSEFDRGLGKTTLLRAIALVEAWDKPVVVFVPNYISARDFLRGMPREVLESAQMKFHNTTLEWGKGIRVLSCADPHKLYGCARECILVDDARKIDPKILDFHGARARKMFICS